jgi:DNA-binding transcriptional ArsR family regulator
VAPNGEPWRFITPLTHSKRVKWTRRDAQSLRPAQIKTCAPLAIPWKSSDDGWHALEWPRPRAAKPRFNHSQLTRNRLVAYYQRMNATFKALADESRRKLLDKLHKSNGQTLTQLCEHLDMTRQAVAKHLALLESANLVATVWRGREKLHYLNPVPIHEIYERWIGKYERRRLQALSDLKQGLEENKINKKG